MFLHPLFVLVLLLALGAGWGGRSSGRAREREAEENVGLEDWERGWDHLGLRVMQGASFLFRKATGKGPVEVKKVRHAAQYVMYMYRYMYVRTYKIGSCCHCWLHCFFSAGRIPTVSLAGCLTCCLSCCVVCDDSRVVVVGPSPVWC